MQSIRPIICRLEIRLVLPGGTSLQVLCDLRYDAHDPWAVRMSFHTGGESDDVVEWLFARALLTDGVRANTGAGDVRVWPGDGNRADIVHLAMTSPSGSALFEVARAPLVAFLESTYLAVPTGAEGRVVDLDRELAELLG